MAPISSRLQMAMLSPCHKVEDPALASQHLLKILDSFIFTMSSKSFIPVCQKGAESSPHL